MLEINRFKLQGRYAFTEGELWMASSLCEVGFRLKRASFLTFALKADGTVTDPERSRLTPRYAIRVNGRLVRDAHLSEPEESISLPAEELAGEPEIRLIKLSECTQSLFALTDLRTDGEISPLPARPGRISFIGDSITCGYGVEAENGLERFSTFTENAEKSYAGLVSEALDMDRELDCYSGYGIVSAWTGDPDIRNLSELVPLCYEKIGRNVLVLPGGKRLQDQPWDFSRFQPDWIVLCLGTNDLSWCRDFQDRKDLFRREYAQFLKMVRRNNPSARILCVLGLMGGGLNESMQLAVEDYRTETGDDRIRSATVPTQDAERDGLGADGHPSVITQRRMADQVLAALRAWGAR